MIYSSVSSSTIISKLFRDLSLQDAHWISDSIEWMGEALDAIGTPVQMESKVKIAQTSSHKTPLPNMLMILEEVRYGLHNADKTDEKPPKYEDFPYKLSYSGVGIHESLVNSYEKTKSAQMYAEEDFFIKGGMIHTSFEKDWVAISYKALALDEAGYPMVPDDYSFSQALYWYVVMKMMEGGMQHPAGLNYFHAEERWLKYCSQARSSAKMPDAAKYREFGKAWVQLLPDYTDRDVDHLQGEYEEPKAFKSVAYSPIKE